MRNGAALLERNDPSGTALITGASSGIGAAFARQLAPKGYHLILVARREERLWALSGELEGRHPIKAEVLVADLSKPVEVERVERRISELESLDLLINSAGFGVAGGFAEGDLKKHLDMIHVHVVASVRLCRAAVPGMVTRRRGAIVNVSSLAAFAPVSTTYSATKAYLNVFSEALQAEILGTGIKIQALCPGYTYSGFHDTPEYQGFRRSRIPKPMWMSAEDVAAQSLNALGQNRVIFIPSFKNRLVGAVVRNLPPSLVQSLRNRSR
jgi:short-subunit dehydrogenase